MLDPLVIGERSDSGDDAWTPIPSLPRHEICDTNGVDSVLIGSDYADTVDCPEPPDPAPEPDEPDPDGRCGA